MTKEEKRIYSVSPAVIVPGDGYNKIVQPLGRQVAQHGHALRKVGFEQARRAIDSVEYEPITTIILQCRDSKELIHVIQLLIKARVAHELFYDRNEELWPGLMLTAVATHPVLPMKIAGILDYLPLLKGEN